MAENSELFSQVAKQIDQRVEGQLPADFRTSETTVKIYGDNNTVPPNPTQSVAVTQWMKRKISYPGPTYLDLTLELLNAFANVTAFSMVDSNGGRLIVDPVAQNAIEVYTAHIYRNDTLLVPLTFTWTQSIALYVNSVKILTSVNSANANGNIHLKLDIGWNVLDIILFSSSADQRFDLGKNLTSVAEGWRTPQFVEVAVPTGLTVAIDSDALSIRDANVNVLRWTPNTEKHLGAYRLYRRGPYRRT